jgi:hypothetical protein
MNGPFPAFYVRNIRVFRIIHSVHSLYYSRECNETGDISGIDEAFVVIRKGFGAVDIRSPKCIALIPEYQLLLVGRTRNFQLSFPHPCILFLSPLGLTCRI